MVVARILQFVPFLVAALATSFPSSSYAQGEKALDCVFEKCFSLGECRDEKLPIAVVINADGSSARITTPGPRPFNATASYDPEMGVLSVVAENNGGATHMLTMFKNGTAAFTSHTSLNVEPEPIWISGTGTCEVTS